MKRLVLAILLLLPRLVSAQTVATPTNHLGWDEVGQTAAIANASTYNAYIDAATTPVALTGVACIGTTTATCTANWPAMTPGTHTLTITQVNGGESGKSAPLSFSFVVVVVPTNVRQVP